MNLTDICRPKQWKTIAMKDLKEKGYPVYGANGIIGFYDKYTHEEPTVMITCRGATCGTINKSLGKAYINGNAMALDNLKYEIVDMNYLYYYLNNYNFKKVISGSAQPQITRTNLKKVKIPVPPMEIQEKIVRVLDQAQALIDKRKEQIKALDQLIESIFYTMFGDPIINSKDINRVVLGDLCTLKAGKFIKAAEISNRDDTENKYPCFGGNGLRGYVKGYTHDGVYPLIGRQGALCGNVHYVDGRFHATEHAIVVKTKVKTNIIWLYYTLKWMNLNRLASGAAQPGLNVGTLLPLKIIHPPLSLQNDFAQKVETIEKQKELLGQSLKLLEENYKSIMEKAFKGQLFN